MILCKLREWVWTETGKGDRLGGRQEGRSEPAFRVASTTALPPPTSISRQKAGQLHLLAVATRQGAGNFICRLCLLQGLCRLLRLLAVCYEACAGHFICRLFATTALLCHAIPCLPAFALAPFLLPLVHFCPCSVLHFPPTPLFITMCARIIAQAARTALLAAATRACTGGPCTVFRSLCSFQKGEALDCV